MNRWEKEVLASWLKDEKTALKAVEGHYTAALAEIKKKIILMEGQDGEMAQSQIYQLQYQKSLQAQISAILEKLHSDEYQTIQAFLEGCYTSGFLGTMYSVAGQGIPLLLPMDPAAVVRAVITDSKLSEDLYDALGVDINNLKRVIRSEISRGIAANLPIDEISRNISMRTGTPLAHAKTIARTESHRIQEAATEDARQAVKKRGCNVIKQWDSTLDGDTRPTHQRLDGQIVETDEPFEMDGKKAMFPGDFGDPAEDCNCRCHALTRAKAAMTERELEVLRGRAKYFGIDKSESFKDFQKKYQKSIEKFGKSDIIYRAFDAIIPFVSAANIEDAAKYASTILGIDDPASYSDGLNLEVANGVNEAISKFYNEFDGLAESGMLKSIQYYTGKTGIYAGYSAKMKTVFLSLDCKTKDAIAKMLKDATEEFEHGTWSTGHAFHAIYHEFGHAVQHMVLDSNAEIQSKINALYQRTYRDIMGDTLWDGEDMSIIAKGCAGAKSIGFSYYGLRNVGEFVAESIAQYFLSNNPSEIAKQVIQLLKGG